MQILVSFSTVVRFVLWLVVLAVVAGSLLAGQSGWSGDEPAGPPETVPVHADPPPPPVAA